MRLLRGLPLLVVLALFGAGCPAPDDGGQPRRTPPGRDPGAPGEALPAAPPAHSSASDAARRDGAVYAAVLGSGHVRGFNELGRPVTELVVEALTSADHVDDFLALADDAVPVSAFYARELPGVSRELFVAFAHANRERVALPALEVPGLAVHLVSDERAAALREFGDAAAYHWRVWTEHPGSTGVVSLSAIGYDAAGTAALVSVGSQQGGLSGAGYLVQLERRGERWRVVRAVEVWIS